MSAKWGEPYAQTCPECSVELSTLQRLVLLGRGVSAHAELATPSPDVWARIRDKLALEPTLQPVVHQSMFPPSNPPESALVTQLPYAPAVEPSSRGARQSPHGTFQASVAGLPYQFEPEPTAHAQLTPVQALWSHASGRAELATDEHGRRLLQVALLGDLPTTGLRQAWLAHRDMPHLRQSIGVLDGPHGLWTVAHTIDLETYAILDISQQNPGQTYHSGQTIVRGELTFVD